MISHMDDGRTRIRFASGEEHRYKISSFHKLRVISVPERVQRYPSPYTPNVQQNNLGVSVRRKSVEGSIIPGRRSLKEHDTAATATATAEAPRKPRRRSWSRSRKSKQGRKLPAHIFPYKVGTWVRHDVRGFGEVIELMEDGRTKVRFASTGEEHRYKLSSMHKLSPCEYDHQFQASLQTNTKSKAKKYQPSTWTKGKSLFPSRARSKSVDVTFPHDVGTWIRHETRGRGQVVKHKEDGRTKVRFENSEEHYYKPSSMHKFTVCLNQAPNIDTHKDN